MTPKSQASEELQGNSGESVKWISAALDRQNREGMSLISVMVAASVASIVMLATSSLMLNAQKGARSVGGTVEFGVAVQSLVSLVQYPDQCKQAFADSAGVPVAVPLPAPGGETVIRARKLMAGGQPYMTVGTSFGSAKLKEILLVRKSSAPNLLYVSLQAERIGEALGSKILNQGLPLIISARFSSTGVIESCGNNLFSAGWEDVDLSNTTEKFSPSCEYRFTINAATAYTPAGQNYYYAGGVSPDWLVNVSHAGQTSAVPFNDKAGYYVNGGKVGSLLVTSIQKRCQHSSPQDTRPLFETVCSPGASGHQYSSCCRINVLNGVVECRVKEGWGYSKTWKANSSVYPFTQTPLPNGYYTLNWPLWTGGQEMPWLCRTNALSGSVQCAFVTSAWAWPWTWVMGTHNPW